MCVSLKKMFFLIKTFLSLQKQRIDDLKRCFKQIHEGNAEHSACVKYTNYRCHQSYSRRRLSSCLIDAFTKDPYKFSVCLTSISDKGIQSMMPKHSRISNLPDDFIITLENHGKFPLYVSLSKLESDDFCKSYNRECEFYLFLDSHDALNVMTAKIPEKSFL